MRLLIEHQGPCYEIRFSNCSRSLVVAGEVIKQFQSVDYTYSCLSEGTSQSKSVRMDTREILELKTIVLGFRPCNWIHCVQYFSLFGWTQASHSWKQMARNILWCGEPVFRVWKEPSKLECLNFLLLLRSDGDKVPSVLGVSSHSKTPDYMTLSGSWC